MCRIQYCIKALVENASEGLGIGLAVLGSGEDITFTKHTALKGHDAHAFIFFRRHCNTSFWSDAFILPYFATFFKELFVNCGRRDQVVKMATWKSASVDFGQRGETQISVGQNDPLIFFGMLAEAFSLSSVPQYLRFYSRVDILSARWKALSVCLLVTKCTYNCQNHRVIILITRWIRAITLPTFCRLDCVLQRIWPSRPHFEALIPFQRLILRRWMGILASKPQNEVLIVPERASPQNEDLL